MVMTEVAGRCVVETVCVCAEDVCMCLVGVWQYASECVCVCVYVQAEEGEHVCTVTWGCSSPR